MKISLKVKEIDIFSLSLSKVILFSFFFFRILEINKKKKGTILNNSRAGSNLSQVFIVHTRLNTLITVQKP